MRILKHRRNKIATSRVQVKCNGTVGFHGNMEGVCELCGRWLQKNGSHCPNRTGSLGWILTYSDGAVFIEPPITVHSHAVARTVRRASDFIYGRK